MHCGGVAKHKKTPDGKPSRVYMSIKIRKHHVQGRVSVHDGWCFRFASKLAATHAVSAVMTQVAVAISYSDAATVVT
jgi:hypothetical protein